MKRYKARYNFLFPILDTKENTVKISQYFLENRLDVSKPNRILIKSSSDHATSTALAILLSTNSFPSMIYLNSYELVEIFLDQHEVYSSLSTLRSDILYLTKGYGELPNAQLNNMIVHVINQYRAKTLIFYLKGRDIELENILVKEYNFNIINLDSLFSTVKPQPKRAETSYGGYDL